MFSCPLTHLSSYGSSDPGTRACRDGRTVSPALRTQEPLRTEADSGSSGPGIRASRDDFCCALCQAEYPNWPRGNPCIYIGCSPPRPPAPAAPGPRRPRPPPPPAGAAPGPGLGFPASKCPPHRQGFAGGTASGGPSCFMSSGRGRLYAACPVRVPLSGRRRRAARPSLTLGSSRVAALLASGLGGEGRLSAPVSPPRGSARAPGSSEVRFRFLCRGA